MVIAGIICEYNPFHNGHAYHISETRRLLGSECAVVCVMSGNFVQRGEAALFPKMARTKAALAGGADLVLELPLPWAIGSAGHFAAGGIGVLSALGLPVHLSFGSECGDSVTLSEIADRLLSPSADELIRKNLESGLSYAEAQQNAADELLGEKADLLKNPNDLLGIEYIKASKTQNAAVTPIAVKRFGTAHDSAAVNGGFASASHIRRLVLGGEDISGLVSKESMTLYGEDIKNGAAPTVLSEGAVLYRLRTMSDGDFAALPDSGEGLANRLAKYARTESSVADILEKTKTKRYALSRLRRMILAAYLGVTAEMQEGLPPYVRVLGANTRGQEILRAAKDTASLPIITKPASAKKLTGSARDIFELESRATDLYVLSCPVEKGRGGSEWTTSPIIIK